MNKIDFNERSLEAFEKEGLEPPRDLLFKKAQQDKFKSKFKEEKGPLQKIINSMHRRPKVTFDRNGKAIKKDFLTYHIEYHGNDWLGNRISVFDEIQGVCKKPRMTITTTIDPETGNHVAKKQNDGVEEEYYIELTGKNRKQVIEDIINSCSGSIVDSVRFYGHFPNSPKGPSFRCDLYSYDQFINSSIEELERLGRKEGGPQGNAPYSSKDKKTYMG